MLSVVERARWEGGGLCGLLFLAGAAGWQGRKQEIVPSRVWSTPEDAFGRLNRATLWSMPVFFSLPDKA